MDEDKKKSSRNADEPESRVDIAGEIPNEALESVDSRNETEQQILIAMDDDGTVTNTLLNSIPGEKVADDGGGGGGGGGGKGGGGYGNGDDADAGGGDDGGDDGG